LSDSKRSPDGVEPSKLNGHEVPVDGPGLIPYAEAVVDSIRESLLVLDGDMRVRMANRAFYDTFRLSPEETLNKSIWRLADGQWNISRLRFLLENVQSSIREFKNFELEHTFKTIGKRTLMLNAHRLKSEGHDLVLLAIEDTTDRKRIAEELRDSEERFRQLAENIEAVFWMTDVKDDRLLYVSPGYEMIYGRPRTELYQSRRSWLDVVHPEDKDRVTKALSKQAKGRYDEEYRILRSDGSIRWIRELAFPVKDNSGRVYRVAGIAEDITELKRAENLILEISGREQRRIGQDMHDGLCQSLTGLRFLSKVLAEKLAAKNMTSEATQADEIGKLVSQALTQADVTAKGLFPVELEERGFLSGLKAMAAGISRVHNIPCSVEGEEAGALVTDPVVSMHLFRIAQEAVTNSVKHGQAKNIRIELSVAGGRTTLAIHDDGVGITRNPKKRTGMGMNIMRFRAGKIGGMLNVLKNRKGGTTITCTFQNIERTNNFGRRRDDQIAF
jgi:PAS domain S-box-containing protein